MGRRPSAGLHAALSSQRLALLAPSGLGRGGAAIGAHGRALSDPHRRQRRAGRRARRTRRPVGPLDRRPIGSGALPAVAAGSGSGHLAAGRRPVPALAAILAVRRHRRLAGGGRLQRARRRHARRCHGSVRPDVGQSGFSGGLCVDPAGSARRTSGHVSPLAGPTTRTARGGGRGGISAAGGRGRGCRSVPARARPGPGAGVRRRGIAHPRRPPDRTAHPGPSNPRLDRRRRRCSGPDAGGRAAAARAGGRHAGSRRPAPRGIGRAGGALWHDRPPGTASDRS